MLFRKKKNLMKKEDKVIPIKNKDHKYYNNRKIIKEM